MIIDPYNFYRMFKLTFSVHHKMFKIFRGMIKINKRKNSQIVFTI